MLTVQCVADMNFICNLTYDFLVLDGGIFIDNCRRDSGTRLVHESLWLHKITATSWFRRARFSMMTITFTILLLFLQSDTVTRFDLHSFFTYLNHRVS